MSAPAFLNLPISKITDAFKRGDLSPVEVLETCLERIKVRDDTLNAFVHLNENARHQAIKAERAVREGTELGPLHGIPIAVKDNYLTAEMPSTAGTSANVDFPQHDSAAVAALRAAGAILIGKTRMHEFAWGMETPPARNPHDETRVPGGSSGGSGAALAAGMCLAATGSDTGGSIRIPASLCGTVGFKPTFGMISRSGIVPHSWSLDTAGPLTRCVDDAALLSDVMSGPDPDDLGSSTRPAKAIWGTEALPADSFNVGVCRNHFFDALQDDVAGSVESTIELLASAGARIVEFEIPDLAYGLGAIFAIELASSSAYHQHALNTGSVENFSDDVQLLVEMGERVRATDYLHAERFRTRLARTFAEAMREIDVVVGPTMPVTAWTVGQREVTLAGQTESVLESAWRLTYPWNLLGLPAITLPCGRDRDGLPIGFQMAGRPFDDARVVTFARIVENLVN
ncbi:glutamyl-tRNA(Gln) amidotransferase subunit A [Fulvimarina pelagi HTCC2506]|uniref:Indoleacetamide hydrolase n=1 Tax=Fulvimarina pelagi HTCC2506 TaxID=314231 RepID=Q0FY65_9HYPH|nr:amidase [Fulvimarina pelagi]EAU39877.1 glutamyl-tRNA(Gln) amidotransferase subunit A [Fulvimarina pelagi HTCC2506]